MDNPLDPDCVCHGNWRLIVKDTEHLLGDKYACDHGPWKGPGWTLFGIVHGDDDFYYGMSRNGQCVLLTCVGSIEDQGFKRVGCGHFWRYDSDVAGHPDTYMYRCLKCDELEQRHEPI